MKKKDTTFHLTSARRTFLLCTFEWGLSILKVNVHLRPRTTHKGPKSKLFYIVSWHLKFLVLKFNLDFGETWKNNRLHWCCVTGIQMTETWKLYFLMGVSIKVGQMWHCWEKNKGTKFKPGNDIKKITQNFFSILELKSWKLKNHLK